jgi:hypothetical protein
MIANVEVYETDKTIREVARKKTNFSKREPNELLDARKRMEA